MFAQNLYLPHLLASSSHLLVHSLQEPASLHFSFIHTRCHHPFLNVTIHLWTLFLSFGGKCWGVVLLRTDPFISLGKRGLHTCRVASQSYEPHISTEMKPEGIFKQGFSLGKIIQKCQWHTPAGCWEEYRPGNKLAFVESESLYPFNISSGVFHPLTNSPWSLATALGFARYLSSTMADTVPVK